MKELNFINAQQSNKENPKTFLLFDKKEYSKLKIKDLVRLCLNEERFWVEITKINDDNFEGIISNDLINPENKYLSDVIFKQENIFDILKPEIRKLPKALEKINEIYQKRQFQLRSVCDSCNSPDFINTYNEFANS